MTFRLRRTPAAIALVALVAVLLDPRPARAQGAFSAPVQNSFTISFDGSSDSSPGPVSILTTGFSEDFDDAIAGERAFWGSFGGAPDEIVADIVEGVGPNGAGDNAARLTVTDTTPGGYFSGLIFAAKGLRLGNSGGGTASGDEPIPDFDFGINVTVPVRVSQEDARFRINFDTGSRTRSGRYEDGAGGTVSFVQGAFPGLVDINGAGSRVLPIGPTASEIGALPVNTWGTQANVGGLPVALDENPSAANGWTNASFEPFFSRSPRSFDLTRVGVTFPGSGGVGELLLSEWTMTGPDVLKYHPADFNTDEMVDAADIDLLTEAINVLTLNESLPDVPDNNFNGILDFEPVFGVNRIPGLDLSFPEKFSITRTDNVLDQLDVDELVLNILGTNYGDLDLDGLVDAADRSALLVNLDAAGVFGWADGDLDGDDDVDADDLALLDASLGGLFGDYNDDGRVDAADYTLWRDAEGTSATLPNDPLGGTIGAGQYTQWADNYGAGADAAAVPEPAALLGALTACLALSLRRR
ncbi:hypothetical protein [Botrimarina sp.]|uniref:hypothetical protein n=1 Tax=Botrimarina sp. TaxID=2795802 RepID=UPI0032EE2B9E